MYVHAARSIAVPARDLTYSLASVTTVDNLFVGVDTTKNLLVVQQNSTTSSFRQFIKNVDTPIALASHRYKQTVYVVSNGTVPKLWRVNFRSEWLITVCCCRVC